MVTCGSFRRSPSRSKMIVREPGGRPTWVPIPFIPALSLEQLFFERVRSALAFAVQHLDLAFPCAIEMGLLGTADVALAVNTENIQKIRSGDKVVCREPLENASDATVNAALRRFFSLIYDATGFARPACLFGFPPDRPQG
jgi:hypothetical protein